LVLVNWNCLREGNLCLIVGSILKEGNGTIEHLIGADQRRLLNITGNETEGEKEGCGDENSGHDALLDSG
jgi:hypothetical protein